METLWYCRKLKASPSCEVLFLMAVTQAGGWAPKFLYLICFLQEQSTCWKIMLYIVMQQSQSLNGLGSSSYKSCACFRRNKMQSFRTSCSTWLHQTIQGIFLAFCQCPAYQKARHLEPCVSILCQLITKNPFLSSPLHLPKCSRVLLQETNDSSHTRRVPVLKCAEAC